MNKIWQSYGRHGNLESTVPYTNKWSQMQPRRYGLVNIANISPLQFNISLPSSALGTWKENNVSKNHEFFLQMLSARRVRDGQISVVCADQI